MTIDEGLEVEPRQSLRPIVVRHDFGGRGERCGVGEGLLVRKEATHLDGAIELAEFDRGRLGPMVENARAGTAGARDRGRARPPQRTGFGGKPSRAPRDRSWRRSLRGRRRAGKVGRRGPSCPAGRPQPPILRTVPTLPGAVSLSLHGGGKRRRLSSPARQRGGGGPCEAWWWGCGP